MTIISSTFQVSATVTYWALIDMLLWPASIGHRQTVTARLSESTKKSVDIFGSSAAWIRRFENKWSCMLPLVQRSINTQLHEVLGVEPARIVFGGFQTMDRFLLVLVTIPGVQCSRASQPSQQKIGGWW
jgi:hypothetical protein